MYVEEKDSGKIRISDEVIKTVARLAAAEVKGVYDLRGSISEDVNEKLGRKKLTKGIKVNFQENRAHLSINVKIHYGYKIPEICYKIQEKVKSSIETMTDLTVESVDVYIQGINFPAREKKA